MSTQNTRPSGRRPGRGGARRGGRQREDQRDESREGQRNDHRPWPVDLSDRNTKPQSLWARFLALFSPKKPAKPAPRSTNGNGNSGAPRSRVETTSHYPDRPASPRSDRFSDDTSSPVQSPAPARISRKPEAVEVTSPKLYVGNLSFDTAESDLSELFSGVGAVQTAEIVTHKDTEKSKGFGFVMMSTVDEARRAVLELNDKEYMGRKLVVSGAKTNDRN